MQKQESFYYQAWAGAPTVTNTVDKERSPELWVTFLYRVFSREKFEKQEFLGWETSNWLPSVEGLDVGFSDWFLFSRAGPGFWLVPIT